MTLRKNFCSVLISNFFDYILKYVWCFIFWLNDDKSYELRKHNDPSNVKEIKCFKKRLSNRVRFKNWSTDILIGCSWSIFETNKFFWSIFEMRILIWSIVDWSDKFEFHNKIIIIFVIKEIFWLGQEKATGWKSWTIWESHQKLMISRLEQVLLCERNQVPCYIGIYFAHGNLPPEMFRL